MKHEILIESDLEQDVSLVQALLEEIIPKVLAAEGIALPCEVNILLTDDQGIHAINLEQRQVDKPTDVLSFPMFALTEGEKPNPAEADPETGLFPLGDMVLNLEQAALQAQEYGHSLRRETAYLTVHSMLHLLGYDHMDEGPMKAQMRQREEAILHTLGIPREG